MKTALPRLFGTLLAMAPTPLALAKGPPPVKTTSPLCSLTCPAGFVAALYTWEVHPDRIIYDESGKPQIAPDAVWKVSCGVQCEKRAFNVETEVKKQAKALCDSGREPKPYTGPWRITGTNIQECAARSPDGCRMQCAPVQKPVAAAAKSASKKRGN